MRAPILALAKATADAATAEGRIACIQRDITEGEGL